MSQTVDANNWWDQVTDLYSNDQPFTAELNGDEGTITPQAEEDDE